MDGQKLRDASLLPTSYLQRYIYLLKENADGI